MSILKTFIVPHPPIIIPEIGKGREKEIKKTIESYNKIGKEISKIKPDTIIISSPHSTIYSNYFHISPSDKAKGDFSYFGAEQVSFNIRYDHDLRLDLVNECKKFGLPVGLEGEKDPDLDHGTMIPLYFINKYYEDYKLIRISPSGMDLRTHYMIGKVINKVITEDENVVWIASGDLSHKLKDDGPYGYSEEGRIFDDQIYSIIERGAIQELLDIDLSTCYKAAECGLGSITMMFGTMDGYQVKTKIHSYEDTFGVGYLVAEVERSIEDKNRIFINDERYKEPKSTQYVKLAKLSLEYFIKNKKQLPIPENLERDLMDRRAGVFVSLHIGENLRGCIGTIYPTTDSIAEEIIQNAISAGTKDYRFKEVQIDELEYIDYSVDVLMPPERIYSKEELDIKKYGVIVRSGFKSGLLLPNIDGITSVEQQISIAKRKAGISDNETITMERFEVIRYN